jgi:hypothetical protein
LSNRAWMSVMSLATAPVLPTHQKQGSLVFERGGLLHRARRVMCVRVRTLARHPGLRRVSTIPGVLQIATAQLYQPPRRGRVKPARERRAGFCPRKRTSCGDVFTPRMTYIRSARPGPWAIIGTDCSLLSQARRMRVRGELVAGIQLCRLGSCVASS